MVAFLAESVPRWMVIGSLAAAQLYSLAAVSRRVAVEPRTVRCPALPAAVEYTAGQIYVHADRPAAERIALLTVAEDPRWTIHTGVPARGGRRQPEIMLTIETRVTAQVVIPRIECSAVATVAARDRTASVTETASLRFDDHAMAAEQAEQACIAMAVEAAVERALGRQ